MEHAGAVVLHLRLLEVKVRLVRSDDGVAVPHRVHPDWRSGLGIRWEKNLQLKRQTVTSQLEPIQELLPSWRHSSLEEQLVEQQVEGEELQLLLWLRLNNDQYLVLALSCKRVFFYGYTATHLRLPVSVCRQW